MFFLENGRKEMVKKARLHNACLLFDGTERKMPIKSVKVVSKNHLIFTEVMGKELDFYFEDMSSFEELMFLKNLNTFKYSILALRSNIVRAWLNQNLRDVG